MAIVIKKQVSLEFLGEEYKDSYLTFTSMTLREYEELQPTLEKSVKDKKSMELVKDVLTKHFLGGKFQGQDVTQEDLFDFDIETLMHCFQIFTGQGSPKVEAQ